ncbi:hypothetical protein SAMN05192534_105100 [Alteribacillus persepolensis]|uniref:Uncharacterized protein n=1 Tax=Alteribacillus persepolensis TaxID=568899 RepID=A0A1G8C987_9BACI|nr:hypothetical protein SAMN05192534_105100 [Alteribacillus persepolensis]
MLKRFTERTAILSLGMQVNGRNYIFPIKKLGIKPSFLLTFLSILTKIQFNE